MTTLSDNQKKFYEDALNQTKGEIQELENQILEELAAVKQKIADLQAGANEEFIRVRNERENTMKEMQKEYAWLSTKTESC